MGAPLLVTKSATKPSKNSLTQSLKPDTTATKPPTNTRPASTQLNSKARTLTLNTFSLPDAEPADPFEVSVSHHGAAELNEELLKKSLSTDFPTWAVISAVNTTH